MVILMAYVYLLETGSEGFIGLEEVVEKLLEIAGVGHYFYSLIEYLLVDLI